jgi:biotin-dependent carboxylase-like uncharacterized protein
MAIFRIERAGALATIQDAGRFGALVHGVGASGPMDRSAFQRAGRHIGASGSAGIEVSVLGITAVVEEGSIAVGWDGGDFSIMVNDSPVDWPGSALLKTGDRLTVVGGPAGNYGYLRFGGELVLPPIMGSRSTSLRVGLGGLEGRSLQAGDRIKIVAADAVAAATVEPRPVEEGPIRFIWGLHADIFSASIRDRFVTSRFRISSQMDRMGVRLRDEAGVLEQSRNLLLVSEPVVVGDIQILGDGTPIVLGRDHQTTGGYPRIGTVITADLDRFFQLRPNSEITLSPVGLDHAQALLRSVTP